VPFATARQPWTCTNIRTARSKHQTAGRLFFLLGAVCAVSTLWSTNAPCWTAQQHSASRRDVLAAGVAAATLTSNSDSAEAFANAVRQFKRDINDPKKKGLQPSDLGMLPRDALEGEVGLRECSNDPHCFSTTNQVVDAERSDLKPWVFEGKTPEAAMQEVANVIKAYKPGQQGIDGGGFFIEKEEKDYIYTQFESFRRGHLDDVEFALEPNYKPEATSGKMFVRSSSRESGFYDYGVNAVRLNTISDALKKNGGWKMDRITQKTHRRYWGFNCDGGKRSKALLKTAEKFPDYCTFPES